VNGSENRCSFIFDKKYDELRWFRYSHYGLRYERLQVIRKISARDQASEAYLREPAFQLPVEDIDNHVRIMPVGRADGSWGIVDSNDFNLFTRCLWKLFRKERIHLLGMRRHGKSEGKDKYGEDELFHVMHRFYPFGNVLR